jgi:hypothetical protein
MQTITAPKPKPVRPTLGALKQKVGAFKATLTPSSPNKLRGWLAQSAASTREKAVRSWRAIARSGQL